MAWVLLRIAGLLEVGWAIGLKHPEGITRVLPSALTLDAMLPTLGAMPAWHSSWWALLGSNSALQPESNAPSHASSPGARAQSRTIF